MGASIHNPYENEHIRRDPAEVILETSHIQQNLTSLDESTLSPSMMPFDSYAKERQNSINVPTFSTGRPARTRQRQQTCGNAAFQSTMDHTVDASQNMKPVKSISPGKKSGKSKTNIGKPKLVKTAKNSDYDHDSSGRK